MAIECLVGGTLADSRKGLAQLPAHGLFEASIAKSSVHAPARLAYDGYGSLLRYEDDA